MQAIEMYNFEGVCKYCGNIQPILAADQADADFKISEKCECGGAAREKQWDGILENIETLLGGKAETRGFNQTCHEQVELAQNIAARVMDGYVRNVTLTIENTVVTITMTNSGRVKIARKYTKQTTLEA